MFKRLHTFVLVLAMLAWPASAADRTIVVVGDSLSSGYGLGAGASWVALLEERLEHEAYGYEVVNASIAGDTTAGGLARLPRLLERHEPAVVIIELGGNDGLRGQPVSRLRDNLARMIELAVHARAEVLLLGIQIPPNYGTAYTTQFSGVYGELAERYDVGLVPFLMKDVALDATRMQGDGIHPNAAGQAPMLDNVWPVLEELL